MFHLVNSVYVHSDPYMDRAYPHYNLSAETGYEAVIADGVAIPAEGCGQLGYAVSLDKLTITEFKAWLRTMVTHKNGRMMVWVDPMNYAYLFGAQTLAMDPGMSLEDFTFFMTTVKVKFDTIRLTSRSTMVPTPLRIPIAERINQIYRIATRYAPIMADMLYSDNNKWSLEWRIKHLVETGECLGVRATVDQVQRRNLIMSCLEALGEVQHLVGDRSKWEALGCDSDTLLNSDTVFHGLLAFNSINSDWLLGASPFDTPVTNTQLIDAAKEALVIFKLAGDQHMIDRTGYHIETVEGLASGEYTTLDVVQRLFGGRIHGCRVNDVDSTKYNETTIKYFLSKV